MTRLTARTFGLGTGLRDCRRDHVGARRTYRVTLTFKDGAFADFEIATHFSDMALSMAKAQCGRRDIVACEAVLL